MSKDQRQKFVCSGAFFEVDEHEKVRVIEEVAIFSLSKTATVKILEFALNVFDLNSK